MFRTQYLVLIFPLVSTIFASCGLAEPPAMLEITPTPLTVRPTVPHPVPEITSAATALGNWGTFKLASPTVAEGGMLPAEYTCDGANSTLALRWSGAPTGTQSYVVIMHHVASPTDIHWYWVLYDIPASVTSLPKNVTGIGMLGTNSVNDKAAYTPPCSKGPGPKVYTYTIYALSSEPQLSVPASQVNRAVLLDAIKKITLATAELHVVYSRNKGEK